MAISLRTSSTTIAIWKAGSPQQPSREERGRSGLQGSCTRSGDRFCSQPQVGRRCGHWNRRRRWANDKPPSLEKFTSDFADDYACAEYLAKKRWKSGFQCPRCGGNRAWRLEVRPWVWECQGVVVDDDGTRTTTGCRHQTSLQASTVMQVRIFRCEPGSSPPTFWPPIRTACRPCSSSRSSVSAVTRRPGFCCSAGRWSIRTGVHCEAW